MNDGKHRTRNLRMFSQTVNNIVSESLEVLKLYLCTFIKHSDQRFYIKSNSYNTVYIQVRNASLV